MVTLTVAFVIAAGCTQGAAPEEPREGGVPPRFVDGGPLPDARVTCGDASCPDPRGGDVLGEIACCLPSGGCGARVPLLGDRCLAAGQPGAVDPTCPSFVAPNGAIAQGCCGPPGRCGYYDRFGDLGCVVADSSDAGARCRYDPRNDCRSITAIVCDGPEDCGPGYSCCGRLNFGLYEAFGCFVSCAVAEQMYRGLWLEMCHSDDDCRGATDRCEAADALQAPLARCYPHNPKRMDASTPPPEAGADATTGGDATVPRTEAGTGSAQDRDASVESGEGGAPRDASPESGDASAARGVACGAVRCDPTEVCCTRDPEPSYCAPRRESCSCGGPGSHDE